MSTRIIITAITNWLLPAAAGVALFLWVQPTLAQIPQPDESLNLYLDENSLSVGTESSNGYQQVYYEYNGQKVFITDERQNSVQPAATGAYIAYVRSINGAGQIFLHHIPTDTTTQLTIVGTNLQPRVDRQGRVAWQKWAGDQWQIALFDGTGVQQVTGGDASFNVEFDGDALIYVRQSDDSSIRAVRQTLDGEQAGREDVLGEGAAHKYPHLFEENVVFGSPLQRFSIPYDSYPQDEPELITAPVNHVTTPTLLPATPTPSSPETTPGIQPSPEPSPELTETEDFSS